jgi:hypothetical protein
MMVAARRAMMTTTMTKPERFNLKRGAPFGELGIDEKTNSDASTGGEPNGAASN